MLTARPDVTVLDVHPTDDFLVVASDGLWDSVDAQTVVNFVGGLRAEGADRDAITSALVKVAIEAGARDNVTVVLVDLAGNHPSPSPSFSPGESESDR